MTYTTVTFPSGVGSFSYCVIASNIYGTTVSKVYRAFRVPDYEVFFAWVLRTWPAYFPSYSATQNIYAWVVRVDPMTVNKVGVCTAQYGCPDKQGVEQQFTPYSGRGVYVMGPLAHAMGAPDTDTPLYVGELDDFPWWP